MIQSIVVVTSPKREIDRYRERERERETKRERVRVRERERDDHINEEQ